MNNLRKKTGRHSERAQLVGALLAKKRRYAGLTLRDVGQTLGVPFSTVSKIEHADRAIGLLEFIEYCQKLGLSEIDMFQQVSKIYHDNPEVI